MERAGKIEGNASPMLPLLGGIYDLDRRLQHTFGW